MRTTKLTISAIAGALLAVGAGAVDAPSITNLIYSVDIGSDWEVSDPNPSPPDSPDVMDPGDMYMTPLNPQVTPPANVVKNDFLIWGDPEAWPVENNPLTAVPVPTPTVPGGSQEDAAAYFDMDGEDQLDTDFQIIIYENEIPVGGTAISFPLTAQEGGGLKINPDRLIFSYDDDQAEPWWQVNSTGYGDVPVTAYPDYGVNTNEVLYARKWRVWPTDLPLATETDIGLGPDPWQMIPDETWQNRDDDVDALDNELHRYWYWTTDHEAHNGLDPADIYITDRNYPFGNYTLAIDNIVLGVNDGTDIDAFEFCLTSDDDIIEYFNNDGQLISQLDTNNTYLAVVFSVDQNDPTTNPTDESGGLAPNAIYISLLTGNLPGTPGPLEINRRVGANGFEQDEENMDDDDIDAITFEEAPVYTEDWGDAPDNIQGWTYPTLNANNGARHKIVKDIYLGYRIDGDADGQPTVQADGDDIDVPDDDEDGVYFTSRLYQNYVASVVVEASTNGYLNAWIDFGADSSWIGDQVFINRALHKGYNHLTFPVPGGMPPMTYQTYARFRFTQNQVSNPQPTGLLPDGEVEDYIVDIESAEELEYDFGDAEIVYPVLAANNGARHAYKFGDPQLTLGVMWDNEPDGQPSPDAKGDDITMADEDGVFFSNLYRGSNVNVGVVAAFEGFVGGWIDFNQDGDWDDAGEMVYNGSVVPGPNTLPVSVPAGAEFGRTFARFRISSLSTMTPYGFAPNGEVEDYVVSIVQPAPSGGSFAITNISMVASNRVEVRWEYDAGLWYELQSATLLQSNMVWNLVDFVPAGSCIDTNAWETNKFYRVVVPHTP